MPEGYNTNSEPADLSEPWFPIDNAANLYTATRTNHWSRTFRIALLLDSEIEPELLQQALCETAKRFPSMCAKLKDGLFWSYFERTDETPQIAQETDYPYRHIEIEGTRQPCFRVLYFQNRIALEMFHGIADGGGAIRFLSTLVGRYLELSGEYIPKTDAVLDVCTTPLASEVTDSYHDYYDENYGIRKMPDADVLHNENKPEKDYVQLIHGLCRVDVLKATAKKYSLSITEYLSAALIYMFINCSDEPVDKPVSISVPIDLRKRFPSETVRNFAYMTDVTYNPHGRTDVPFKEIADSIRGVLKNNTEIEKLHASINSNVSSQDSKLTRPIPNALKRLFLKQAYRKSQNSYTTFLSNYGEFPCPPEMAKHILRAELLLGDTPYIHFGCAAVSVNGLFNLTFSSGNGNTEKQKFFFRFLASDGIPLRIESNIYE